MKVESDPKGFDPVLEEELGEKGADIRPRPASPVAPLPLFAYVR